MKIEYSAFYTKKDEEGFYFWEKFCNRFDFILIGWTFKQQARICTKDQRNHMTIEGWFAEQMMKNNEIQ